MDLAYLTQHPEHLNKETLYQLRETIARYPYYQTARLLLLQNLYILHDPSFDEELSRSAIYITDRRVLFNLVEAAHYDKKETPQAEPQTTSNIASKQDDKADNRTISLIDEYLHTAPSDEEKPKQKESRKPTAADATIDYVAYLMQMENEEEQDAALTSQPNELKGQDLIDSFLHNDGGRIQLESPTSVEPLPTEEPDDEPEEGIYTETMAKIYIKQGQYSKAHKIITQLNLNNPKKSIYFADQLRFIEKLILNNKQNN